MSVQPGHRFGAEAFDRAGEQVGLVVPLASQDAGDGVADPNGLTSPAAPGELVAALLAGEAQLLVELAQGHDRCRVVGDRPVDAGGLVEHLADGEVEQRRRTPGRRLAWASAGPASSSASRLSVTMSTPRIPGSSAEPAAGHHAGDVGRHDHGDRREAIAALRPLDGRSERCEHVRRRAT